MPRLVIGIKFSWVGYPPAVEISRRPKSASRLRKFFEVSGTKKGIAISDDAFIDLILFFSFYSPDLSISQVYEQLSADDCFTADVDANFPDMFS